MTDRLDDLLLSIGEEQNDRVDFDQMYADLLQKQKEEEKKRSIRRSRFVRYGAMAACAVVLVGIGAAMVGIVFCADLRKVQVGPGGFRESGIALNLACNSDITAKCHI